MSKLLWLIPIVILGYWIYESADNHWVCSVHSKVVSIQFDKANGGLFNNTSDSYTYRYADGRVRVVRDTDQQRYPEIVGKTGCSFGYTEAH